MEIKSNENDSPKQSFMIKCTDLPQEFFKDRSLGKKYFRRYGKVKALYLKPKTKTCLVEFASYYEMLNALELGGEFNGNFFNIERHDSIATRKRKPKADPDPNWIDDPDVQAELEAMSGAFIPRDYNLRSEKMVVDSAASNKAATKLQRAWKSSKNKTSKSNTMEENMKLTAEQSELIDTIIKQAHTIEEKYKILDARDKLLRSRLKKNIDVMKTKATKGTCPDMCPEKERLLRVIQHQVSIYEQWENDKGMDPKLAVKQYSRSSADQEMPLPQELRPVPVLQMTMGYLMHRIINLCDNQDVNLGEWYHFLWDRTRGIRKDITQQELCCKGSVELVEQCARFHIFCSARLVSEDPSIFDQKINTENLTKCLQTLKYMYHDLQLKGISCENEAEFRAYIILLNLNDGNFMWEVQNLKREIQQSKPIRFALSVYSSLDKNNYVKFFKLVMSTTYLNACILMRYFVQVRLSALNTLLKCYAPRISNASIPVQDLTKMLAFEDDEATFEFLECYGLYSNSDRSHIILDKKSFQLPEYPFVLERAIRVIESKRMFSVGQVVCGKELPPKLYEAHIPQNSFDKDGYLILENELKDLFINKKDDKLLLGKDENDSTTSSITDDVIVETSNKPIETNESIIKTTTVIDATPNFAWTSPPIVSNTSIFHKPSLPPPPPQPQPPIIMATTKIIPPVIQQPPIVIIDDDDEEEEQRKRKKLEFEMEEKRRKDEEEKLRLQQKQNELLKSLEEQKRQLQLLQEKALKEKEKQQQQLELKRQEKIRQQKILQEKLRKKEIEQNVNELLNNLLDEVVEKYKQEKLYEIKTNIKNRKLKNYIIKWQEKVRKKRKRKYLDFNPIILSKSLEDEANDLKQQSQFITLSDMKRYKLGKPNDIIIDNSENIEKINIFKLTHSILTKKFTEIEMKLPQELFWKISISLPSNDELCNGLNHIHEIITKTIGDNNIIIENSKNLSPNYSYCIQILKGMSISKNDSSGLIFIADNYNNHFYNRLVKNLNCYETKIPIVLILKQLNNNLELLTKLKNNDKISNYLILIFDSSKPKLIDYLKEGIQFLAKNIDNIPPLQMDKFESFLNKQLSDLWRKINSFAKWNSNYRECLKNPNIVIYIYNEMLSRLKTIILDDDCRKFKKFPEFLKQFLNNPQPDCLPCDYRYFPNFWDKSTYFKHLEKIIDNFKLPKYINWPPLNQNVLENNLKSYCEIFKNPTQVFYRLMAVFLKNIDDDFGTITDTNWVEIVEILVEEKLNNIDFSLYGTGFVNQTFDNDTIVVYNIIKLLEFNHSDWFYVNHPLIKNKITELLKVQNADENNMRVMTINQPEIDLDNIINKIRRPKHNISSLTDDIKRCNVLMDDLSESYEIHKNISKKTEQILQNILKNS